MKSLSKEKKQYDLIDAFNSTFRYLDDLLNIDYIHFEHKVHITYPAELQLNKANASDTEAALWYTSRAVVCAWVGVCVCVCECVKIFKHEYLRD